MSVSNKFDRIGDDTVKAKTGKLWQEWFKILDKARTKKMNHKEIFTFIHSQHGVSKWWSRMITVAYERERGLREKYQQPEGYEISCSKIIAVPICALYEYFYDAKKREMWLGKRKITIRKATKSKSMRITWSNGKTNLDVNFYKKGNNKSQIAVQHSKLTDLKTAEKMKPYWKGKLEKLNQLCKFNCSL
ncbi:MAG: hypothetical protein ISS16_02590 [Ignavibacteria bacterium]|nr:hypothetical protein [Ignavibacteria bacterium]